MSDAKGIHFSLTEFVFISRDYNVYPVSLSICVPVHSQEASPSNQLPFLHTAQQRSRRQKDCRAMAIFVWAVQMLPTATDITKHNIKSQKKFKVYFLDLKMPVMENRAIMDIQCLHPHRQCQVYTRIKEIRLLQVNQILLWTTFK